MPIDPVTGSIIVGALGGILGSSSKAKERKQQQAQWEAEMKLRREQQAAEMGMREKEFDWRKQGDAWDMRQKDIEFGNKRANANANVPMARQIMASLHKRGGYAPLEMMEKYAKGEAYFPESTGTGVPVPDATAAPSPTAGITPQERPRPQFFGGKYDHMIDPLLQRRQAAMAGAGASFASGMSPMQREAIMRALARNAVSPQAPPPYRGYRDGSEAGERLRRQLGLG